MLDYLAADYPGAVKAGTIVAQSEFDEQKRTLADARQIATSLLPSRGHEQARAALIGELNALERDVLALEAADRIASDSLAVHRRLVDDFGLVVTPVAPPELSRARTLYQSACAACHGVRGRADTTQARSLKPRPTNFLDRERMARISPALAFQAMTFGVAETAMPSFELLPPSERWDLAFYLVAMRHAPGQAVRGGAVARTLRPRLRLGFSRLATLSDAQLGAVLGSAGVRRPDRAALIAYLRRIASFAAQRGGAFADARRLLVEVGKAAGDPVRAGELALAAYTDGVEPHEATLKDRDRPLATRLEGAFARLRRAIDSRAAPETIREEVGRALTLLDRVDEGEAIARANLATVDGSPDHRRPAGRGQAASATPDASTFQSDCGEGKPGHAAGPSLRRRAGLIAFDVFKDCVWPESAGLAIAVSVRQTDLPSRRQVSELLYDLWKQAKEAMGSKFPRVVQLCAFASGTRQWSTHWLGCLKSGFEPPGEEPGEMGPELENRTPYSLAEEANRLLQSRAARFAGRHRLRVRVDERRREVTVRYPYLQTGADRWAERVRLSGALDPFFPLAGDFYSSSVAEPKRLRFVGVWRNRAVLKISLSGELSFRALNQWSMLERLHKAAISSDPRARSPEQEETVRREYEAALARLPQESVWVDPLLRRTLAEPERSRVERAGP